MLTEEEKKYERYLAGKGYRWLTAGRLNESLEMVVLPDEVATIDFYLLNGHFEISTAEYVFGLLDVLKKREIESIIEGKVFELAEDRGEMEYLKENPNTALIIANEDRWKIISRACFSSIDEWHKNEMFKSSFAKYNSNTKFEPPGYSVLNLYANPNKLIQVYKEEGIKILSQEEIEQFHRTREKLINALSNQDFGALNEVVQETIDSNESLREMKDSIDSKDLAGAILLSTDTDEEKTVH